MRSKRKFLQSSRLYVILDAQVADYDRLFEVAKTCVSFGVGILQLRDKIGSAAEILKFSVRMMKLVKGKALYIVNDRPDIALLSSASGVHLGQDDLSVSHARKILPHGAIVGVSCQSYAHAKRAVADGADYLGFGSVFKTLTKPDRSPMRMELLAKVIRNIPVPVFAIGGINAGNIGALRQIGVRQVAVCRDICLSRNVKASIKPFL